jgi:hypothetical protein
MDIRFKPLRIFIFAHKLKVENRMVRCMLRHLEELFDPVLTKIIYCYGEYQKEFDEFLPNI